MKKLPPRPRWSRVNSREWAVVTIKADGTVNAYRVCKTNFDSFGRGRKQWYVLENGRDPLWLAATIAEARDEFLLMFHGWRRPFGFVDGDGTRPIYGKAQQRRERAELLAEIKAAYRAQRKALKP